MLMDLEVTVARPVGEVFGSWADLEKAPQWAAPVVERQKATSGPVGVGTRFHAVDQFPGRSLEFDVEVVRFEQDKLMAVELSPPMDGWWEARFEPVDQGTHMSLQAEVSPPGPLKMLTPLVRRWMRRAVEKDLENFKHVLEDGHHDD